MCFICVQDPIIPGLEISDSTVGQKIYKYAVSLSTLLFMVTNIDVKRGQNLEAETEAEARALRPRPRPRPEL